MTSFNPTRAGLLRACLTLGLLSGCHDASEPLAVVLTEETRGVLAAEANLPSLPRLAAEAGAEARLSDALEGWSRSWDLPVEQGRELRSSAYLDSAEPLAEALGDSAVAESVRSVGETLVAAAALGPEHLTHEISETLREAGAEHARAAAALADGQDVPALEATLRASDLIREVGPESMARLLVARAEERLGALQARGVGTDAVDLERGRRLLRGARLALTQGDFVRAVQRAFYACQVLGVEPG